MVPAGEVLHLSYQMSRPLVSHPPSFGFLPPAFIRAA
jgi:hypothetical protein